MFSSSLQHDVDRHPAEKSRRGDSGPPEVDQRLAELQPGSERHQVQHEQHHTKHALPPEQHHIWPPENRHVHWRLLRPHPAGDPEISFRRSDRVLTNTASTTSVCISFRWWTCRCSSTTWRLSWMNTKRTCTTFTTTPGNTRNTLTFKDESRCFDGEAQHCVQTSLHHDDWIMHTHTHLTHLSRYYENRTGERFSALDGRLNSISMEIDTISSSLNATVSHVQSMYKYINIESSSCQSRMGQHTEDLQVGATEEFIRLARQTIDTYKQENSKSSWIPLW